MKAFKIFKVNVLITAPIFFSRIISIWDGSEKDASTRKALASAEHALVLLAEQRLETDLKFENEEEKVKRIEEEEKDAEDYFKNISVFAANKFRAVTNDYQEKIEIMQEAIEKVMERNNLLQQEKDLFFVNEMTGSDRKFADLKFTRPKPEIVGKI